ncbi:MAG: orotate phosphoribosyltransferase [Candidatus Schekmanbacteria bacterium]|nr:orotate phosphoribosyltransferase [Candidatus Schekmanbacteria bacterium]
MKDRLLAILRRESLQFGDFTLASGKKSKYYMDTRKTALHPEGINLISQLVFSLIKDLDVEFIGGPTIGADPIVSGVALVSGNSSKPLGGFLIRKEKKDHGTGKLIEGCFRKGANVVVVEDVVTTGGSTLNAIKTVEAEGGKVAMVISVIDREEGGRENIEKAGYKFASLFKTSEVLGDKAV